MKRKTILILVVAALLLTAGSALAMASTNYRIDWHALLNGGGGTTGSTHYDLDLTVGQTAIVGSGSANYRVDLGYWPGALPAYQAYMPTTLRHAVTH